MTTKWICLLLKGTATVVVPLVVYDEVFRVEPYLEIHNQINKETSSAAVYLKGSSFFGGIPIRNVKVQHIGLLNLCDNSTWHIHTFVPRNYISSFGIRPINEDGYRLINEEPIIILSKSVNKDVPIEEDTEPFTATLKRLPVQTKVSWVNHWGFQQKRIFEWSEECWMVQNKET